MYIVCSVCKGFSCERKIETRMKEKNGKGEKERGVSHENDKEKRVERERKEDNE